MDKLKKAQELAKHNPYLQHYLTKPSIQSKASYNRTLTKHAEVMNTLARIFNQSPQPFILMNPNARTQPLKLPPLSHQPYQPTLEERLEKQLNFIKEKQRYSTKHCTKER